MPIYQNPFASLTWLSDYKFPFLTENKGTPQSTLEFIRAKTGERYLLPPVSPAGRIMEGAYPIVISYQLDDSTYLLRWRHFDFLIDSQGKSVVCYSDHGVPDQLVWLLLSGLVASFLLMLQGTLAIHASGVVVDQGAVCLMGFSRSGKSTIATALARGGSYWLADDTIAVDLWDGNPIVHPSSPVIKLREESAKHFQLFTGVAIEEKEEVPIKTAGIVAATGYHHLRTVYSLHCHREPLHPIIRPLHGASQLLQLLPHVRAAELAPPSLQTLLFNRCNQLTQAIRFVEFHYPYGLENLSTICKVLLEDIQRNSSRLGFSASG